MEKRYEVTVGEGRARLNLVAFHVGADLMVCISNDKAHIGAAAVGEYDPRENRASTSVITRLGHKDDAIAHEAAHRISRATRGCACVVAGVHVDDITEKEIGQVLENAGIAVGKFITTLTGAAKS